MYVHGLKTKVVKNSGRVILDLLAKSLLRMMKPIGKLMRPPTKQKSLKEEFGEFKFELDRREFARIIRSMQNYR